MNAVQQLLTDHIHIWTAAETEKKSGRGRASDNSASVYGIKKLRELILDLAVRGKLVPQDEYDEPAIALLKQIHTEKTKTSKETRVNKEKDLEPLAHEDLPFALPSSWSWVRLGEITNFGATEKQDYIGNDVWVLDLEDIEKNTSRLLRKVRFAERHSLSDKNAFKKGDILYGKLRPYLNKVIVADEDGVCTTEILPIRCYGNFNGDYFKTALKSPYFLKYVTTRSYGMKMPRLGTADGRKAPFPLAPRAEQNRIVAKVDELMALCDHLEAQHTEADGLHKEIVSHLLGALTQSRSAVDFSENWKRIVMHFDTLFITEASIDALRQGVLQLAVTGRLVAEDANDEPASELLQRVQAEKANLVAEGKIAKAKTSGKRMAEEVPFDLRDNWEWCNFEDLWESSFYGPRFGKDDYVSSGGIPTIRTTDMTSDGLIELSSPPEVLVADDKIKSYRLEYGDLLVTRSGSIGTTALYLFDTLAIPSAYLIRIRLSKLFNPHYALLYLMSPFGQKLLGLNSTSVGVPNVNATKMALFPFPLPPVREQERIIEKVNELVSIFDSLKLLIRKRNEFQHRLANVYVDRVQKS